MLTFGGEILKEATKGITKGAQFIKKLQQGAGVGEGLAEGMKLAGGASKELFNFTGKAASRTAESGRSIPIQILDDIIKTPMMVAKVPHGTKALMHYS